MDTDGPLKTLFDNINKKKTEKTKKAMDYENTDIMHLPAAAGEGSKAEKKRLSIERIYQKKSQIEHILLRPDTYIGSVESVTQAMWVYDSDLEQMVLRDITFVPGLYKIFDEILVNAADNKQRDPSMSTIKIEIDPENNKIKVWNNGRGIPVIEHKTEKMYVPTMIFGHLLTSSNYDDTQKKVTGGRNGYGAKLCNIFSTKFIVETSCKEYHKAFKQTWINNMGKTKEPTITDSKNEDFTSITFFPDLEKFKMTSLTKDTVDLFTRRAYDIAAAARGVKVFLNGKKLPVKNFKDYIHLYLKDKTDDNGQPLPVIHEASNERWEVAVTLSEKGFQQVSFVNSIATTKGGRHVDNVTDQVVHKLIEVVKKKNKGGIAIKPFQVKNHLWIFVNCLIENPTFDSQTKETMTLQAKQFGSKCALSEKFINQVSKCGIVDNILSWMKFKAQTQLNKKLTSSKTSKMKGIPKLDDANDAGTRNSRDCTLILTEGDSAKSLAVAGLGVVGRDKYGVFPLKGKVLNVREATHKQIMDNAEINNIIKIMGLQFKEKYNDSDSLKNLRYGKLMIMTDQDQDGSHIKGLLINFMHHFWPNLLKYNVIEEFITPIVKVTKGKTEMSFYSLPEFEEWKRETENWHTYRVKYYKGLGTSTSKEAKEYFCDMERHKIPFKYTGVEDDAAINLAFSKKKIEERKEWLTSWMEDRKRRSEMGLPENFLYGKGTKSITYNDFINRELILYSNMDNTRSIPSMVDGLKPGQRKVIFTCLKRNLSKEIKVAQLAGSVAEMSAYHHGEASLMNTIINLAQNFVGSNNLNILQPIGQFGTRLHGGKDAASPRYIFTSLSPVARMLFNVHDDPLLKSNFDDNLKIEPEWYCPIIPMVLVNGAEGIGTGWSTKLPNFDVREIIANLKRMLEGEDPLPMVPSYKNFKGTIEELSESRFVASGEVAIIDDQTIEITELPIRTWTQAYKEDVLELMLYGTEKTPAMITDFKEYHTDSTVKFVVKMTPEKMAAAEEQGLHKVFKLQSNISTNTMVLFDHNGCIKRYERITEILKEFFDVRLNLYQKRKDYLEGLLSAEASRLENIARFIMEKIDGLITIENKPKKELIQMLVRRGYDSDPLKRWKELQAKDKEEVDDEEDGDDESTASGSSGGPDFNYILNNPLWCLSKEKKEALLKQRDEKKSELESLKKKTKEDLWMDNLEEFMKALMELEQKEKEEEMQALNKPVKIKGKGVKSRKVVEQMSKPSPMGQRVVPKIDTAMKNKADAAANKLLKAKAKKEAKNLMDCFDKEEEDDVEQTSLAERLEKKTGIKSPTAKENGGVKSEDAEKPAKKKQVRKPKDTSGSPKKKGKKGKKKNPWSDSEESESDKSDSDMDGSFMENLKLKIERPKRETKTKPTKYSFDSDEGSIKSDSDEEFVAVNNEEDDPRMITSEDEDPVSKKSKHIIEDEDDSPVKKPKRTKATKKAPVEFLISSDEEEEVSQKSDDLTWKPATTQDFTPTTVDDDDDDDNNDQAKDIFKSISQPKAATKKTAAKKKPATKKEKPPKESKPKKAAKPKKKYTDESDSEDKPKKASKKRPAKNFSDSDLSEGEFLPKKMTAGKKKKMLESDDEFEIEEGLDVAPRARPGGRSKATVKYNFGDSSEDSDF
ncbi:DNA topoisomerase 2-alpha-like isoform X2 [Ostrea edulis]|uniref:DNA topoisomerase 2-alpha-like isoform X2 n=1 Tax=Ostrea edulis TaxID=37623 RepID=UPI0024AEF568|nr:DNA topoisomerase 2-alpha-like isoform X2 [Ostrea edulis]